MDFQTIVISYIVFDLVCCAIVAGAIVYLRFKFKKEAELEFADYLDECIEED